MTLGIELECAVDREAALASVMAAVGGAPFAWRRAVGGYRAATLSNGWVVSFDPSLRADGLPPERCVEINSPPFTMDAPPPWEALLAALREAGAEITPRCGLHVHLGGIDLTPAKCVAFCRLASEIATSSAARARFLRPIPEGVLSLESPSDEELRQAWYAAYRSPMPAPGRGRLHPARRRIVNLGSVWYRGTLEARWLPATLDPAGLRAGLTTILDLWRKVC